MGKILQVSLAALALAACQKPAGTSSAPSASAGSAAPAASPQRRAGLWQQSFNRDGHATPMATMRLCVDPTTEARASVFTHGVASQRLADSHCTGVSSNRDLGGGYTFASTCPMTGGGSVVSKGAASGDFATAYHIHVENDVSGAAYGPMNGHHVTDIDGKWLGPCPAGMAPGDMEIGHGMRISGGKLAGAAQALAGGGQ
jgi:hypothetical protein